MKTANRSDLYDGSSWLTASLNAFTVNHLNSPPTRGCQRPLPAARQHQSTDLDILINPLLPALLGQKTFDLRQLRLVWILVTSTEGSPEVPVCFYRRFPEVPDSHASLSLGGAAACQVALGQLLPHISWLQR